MGACASANPETKENEAIEAKLDKSKKAENEVFKLLLLGTGESGKSTVFKQLNTLYGAGYSESDRAKFSLAIYSCIVSSFKTLIVHSKHYGTIDSSLEQKVTSVLAAKDGDGSIIDFSLANAISLLWKEPAIQKAFENRASFQVAECCSHFFDKIHEIAKTDYIPSLDDVLRVRLRTIGIVEIDFKIQDHRFRLVDVGGQRSERKKWIHCFENVTAVLFLAAISEYDQTLMEDEKTNRVTESLTLWGEMVNGKWFKKSTMVLFLNKRDLFQEKLKKVPLTTLFPNYTGGNNYDEAIKFLTSAFLAQKKKSKERIIHVHVTCATDKDNIRLVFSSVQEVIIKAALKQAGLVTTY